MPPTSPFAGFSAGYAALAEDIRTLSQGIMQVIDTHASRREVNGAEVVCGLITAVMTSAAAHATLCFRAMKKSRDTATAKKLQEVIAAQFRFARHALDTMESELLAKAARDL